MTISGSTTNSAITFRLARRQDDLPIRQLLGHTRMPGAVTLTSATEPSFFEAIEVKGHAPQVVVAEQAGVVKSVVVIARRWVYIDGAPREIGYFSDLRLDESIHRTTALAQGARFFRELHFQSQSVPFYLGAILEQNLPARNVLTSGRGGLPPCLEEARYCTSVIPVRPKRIGRLKKFEILDGRTVGSDRICCHLNRVGARRPFYPVYRRKDLENSAGPFKGLSPRDFLVAADGDTILGTLALWDQTPFRQTIVAGYSPWLNGLRRLFRLLRLDSGRLALPMPGQPLRMALAACITADQGRPEAWQALLRRAMVRLREREFQFLVVGLAMQDPLSAALNDFYHRVLDCRIYRVYWDQPGDSDRRRREAACPYFELGSL
jgi:hypothetical protein